MIIINLATIDFGGGGSSSKPLITEPLIANVWSRGRRVFTPANYNVDGFSNVTINTAVIGENSALDFSLIGWDGNESDDMNTMYNADIEYSKTVLDKWNNGQISKFHNESKLIYAPKVDISNITSMTGFFINCSSLTTIPLFDTQNVTDMYYMFSGCSSLTTIPLFDTQNVTTMSEMFEDCSSLITIPQLNTSNVIYMDKMFINCSSLTTIPLFDTQNVTDMRYLFDNCSSLTSIPQLNTQNVTKMYRMFYSCSKLQSIPQLDTSNVKDMSYMFSGCSKLQSIPLLNCNKVTNIGTLFGFSNINTLTELGGFKDLKIDWNDSSGLAKLPNLTYQSIMNVLNNLYNFRANGDNTTTRTIKINSNTYNLLTADDIAFANNKGWNITK